MVRKKQSRLVFYSIIALFLVLLLIFLYRSQPNQNHLRQNHHRRLKLRRSGLHNSNHNHKIPFDPLVADIDHAPGFESQPELIENYINDEERFNVTDRIVVLFPNIDVSPSDGFVTAAELVDWNLEQSRRDLLRRLKIDLERHDKNRDGLVSFNEFEPPRWAGDSQDMGWWKEDHFNASDIDEDGHLNLTEFNEFLHPADSSNPKLIQWLCREEIRERDMDYDGKLSFQEFFRNLFESLNNYDEVFSDSDTTSVAPAKKLFVKLDWDKNGFLSDNELRPIIGNIHPSEHYYANQQAEYLLSQADEDKDGHLSLQEMIDHPYVFKVPFSLKKKKTHIMMNFVSALSYYVKLTALPLQFFQLELVSYEQILYLCQSSSLVFQLELH